MSTTVVSLARVIELLDRTTRHHHHHQQYEQLLQQQDQQYHHVQGDCSENVLAVDILAVVVNLSISQARQRPSLPPPPSSSSQPSAATPFLPPPRELPPSADIWISDPSISESDVSVRVTLTGSSEVTKVTDLRVSVGDVLLFKRLSLPRDDNRADIIAFLASNTVSSDSRVRGRKRPRRILLTNPRDEPDPNFAWFRLGHVDSNGLWNGEDHGKGKAQGQGGRIARELVPNLTDSIANLVDWFQRRQSSRHGGTGSETRAMMVPSPSSSGNAQRQHLDVASWEATDRSPVPQPVPPLPSRPYENSRTAAAAAAEALLPSGQSESQRRSLRHIYRSPIGVMSNIIVRVVGYDSQTIETKEYAPTTILPSVNVGYATLSDGSGINLSLLDQNGHYSELLEQAASTGKVLVFTNVTSREQSHTILSRPPSSSSSASKVVCLVPTNSTVAFLVSSEQVAALGSEQNQNQVGVLGPATTAVTSSASATNTSTGKQPSVVPSSSFESAIINTLGNEMTLLSSIQDIWICGTTSLLNLFGVLDVADDSTTVDNNSGDKTTQLLDAILSTGEDGNCNEESYSWAHISLRACVAWGQEKGDGIFIGPEMLKRLCGDVEPKDMRRAVALGASTKKLKASHGDETTKKRSDIEEEEEGRLRLRTNVYKLIRSAVRERILFRWTLDLGSQPVEVTKVILPVATTKPFTTATATTSSK